MRVAIVSLCCLCLFAESDRDQQRAELAKLADQASILSRAFGLIHELAAPSVVSIHTREQFRVLNRSEMRAEVRQVEVGEGSGFIIQSDDKASFILTNAHVVCQTNSQQRFQFDIAGKPLTYAGIGVATNDNRTLDATVVGVDIQTDLAVLRISEPNLPTVVWGNSDLVRVGDWVLAEGYPFGKGYSATAGIVSATDRSTGIYNGVRGFEAFIQTDAAINPGNSGGPLFDLRGEVIGINANIISPTGSNAGLGFAIPSNLARRVAEDLLDDGELSRPMIGVEIQELAAEDVAGLGLSRIHTLGIAKVVPGSPAEKGGLLAGDVVLAINKLPIVNWQQFRAKIAATRPGEPMEFKVWRNGAAVEAVLIPISENQLTNRIGVTLPGFGLLLGGDDKAGLAILHVEPGSLGEQAGLTPGDRLLHERTAGAMQSLDDVRAIANQRELVVQVIRSGRSVWLRLRR